MTQLQDTQRLDSAEIYNSAIAKLRTQVWVWIVIVSGCGMIGLRIVRYLSGVTSSPSLALLMQIALGSVLIGGFLLRNTRYVTYFQFGFLLVLGAFAPLSVLFFGGIRGLGEINIIMVLMGSFLYGFRRLMTLFMSLSLLALVYASYLELIGRPVPPLFDEQSVFFSIKFILMMTLLLLCIYIAVQFYQRLFESYRRFSQAQIKANAELRANAQQLEAASNELKAARQKLITAREEERRRLRRDLHDGLGPTLAAQVFRVGAARNLYAQQPQKADRFLEQIEESVSETLTTIKQLVDELRPPLLDSLGLAAALRQHVQTLQVPFETHLTIGQIPVDLDAATEVAIWRIAQTALDNVARHAQANSCWVTVWAEPQTLCLTIEDDGMGIATDAAEGIGLTSMRERTAELRGTFTIDTHHPQGTALTARLPIHSEALA